MISLAIAKTLFSSKLGLSLWATVLTAFAVTEAFLGQMLIALVVALIGAAPPTVAIILMARKQSEERRAAQGALMQSQEKMHKSLDGKLSELVEARTQVARAEGMQQERTEERERVAEAAPVVAAVIAQAAAAAVKSDPDKVSKMEIVNQDENAVPTREAKPLPAEDQEKI